MGKIKHLDKSLLFLFTADVSAPRGLGSERLRFVSSQNHS